MRLSYTIKAEGILRVQRKWRKKIGPTVEITVMHGKFFGIIIEESYPQALDPMKRFNLKAISDSAEFRKFLKEDFYGFEPFKNCDLKMMDDIEKPVIK